MQKQIDSIGLSDRAFLKGTSKQIHSLIYNASLFVLSSDYEGLPNTLLEAMALGIPSISTDCKPGGAREIIDDGVDGLITPIGDVDKLAAAMLKMIRESDKTDVMAKKALLSMEKFKPAAIYFKWEEYFQNLVR